MKSFYEWYRKHITGAIFVGLILGILTGLFLAGRFNVVLTATSVLGSIYMSALNMMIFPLVLRASEVPRRQVRLQERQCCSSCAQQQSQVLLD